MATYVLLMTLTPAGQQDAFHNPEYLLGIEAAIDVPGVQAMGIYAVLGDYDFVTIVEAEDNERMAQFSLELGVRAQAHIATLPAVPLSHLASRHGEEEGEERSELDPEDSWASSRREETESEPPRRTSN